LLHELPIKGETNHMSRWAAEAFGTFTLVFAGTGAIIINDLSHGAITHVGIALTFGLVVMAMIHAVGSVSGCHLNPAVTVGLVMANRLPARHLGPYWTAQAVGGFLASVVLLGLFPTHPTLGATMPSGSAFQSFLLELILTMMLMFVILAVTGPSKATAWAGAVIGAVVMLEAMFAGPISGASMNPIRSLAPAVVSGNGATVWIYLLAPVIGAALGVGVCATIHGRSCCGETPCPTE
jgi:aquaporin NIP